MFLKSVWEISVQFAATQHIHNTSQIVFLPKYNLLKVDLLILMSSIHQERVHDIPAMLPQVPGVALGTVLNTKFNINLGKEIRVTFQHLCMTRILGPSNPINSYNKKIGAKSEL